MIRPVTSSGLLTADGAVYAQPCLLHGVVLNPAAAASSVVLYDNQTAASGTVVAKVLAVANGTSIDVIFNNPVVCSNGLYLDITGASADCVVYFSPAD